MYIKEETGLIDAYYFEPKKALFGNSFPKVLI